MTTDEYVSDLLQRYKGANVLLDANLLLLYFVGSFDRELISKFKRTKMFVVEDYDTLYNLLGHFRKVVTMPNILTEVSNFSEQLPLSRHLRLA